MDTLLANGMSLTKPADTKLKNIFQIISVWFLTTASLLVLVGCTVNVTERKSASY